MGSTDQGNRHKSQIRVSVDTSFMTLPLTYGLKEKSLNHQMQLHTATPEKCAEHLRQGASDLALIPAIDYGRKKETWLIVPDICVAAPGPSKSLQLFFNSGLRDIKRIAVKNPNGTEEILLRIILQERYEMNPEYMILSASLDDMLKSADAALLTRDDVLLNFRENRNRLDINEEWVDLTGLPFVYTFWAGREFMLQEDDFEAIRKSFQVGHRNIEIISKNYAEQVSGDWS